MKSLSVFVLLTMIAPIILTAIAVGCKEPSKPLVIQENKPLKSYFDLLSDSMNKNMWKSTEYAIKNNRDSAFYYAGKSHAYLEMESKEANK